MLTLSDALAPNSSSLSSVERTAQDDALERQMEQALWREAWTWREAQLGRQVAPDVDVERELWREAWNYRLAQLEAAKADQLFEQTTQALRQTHPAPLETVRARAEFSASSRRRRGRACGLSDSLRCGQDARLGFRWLWSSGRKRFKAPLMRPNCPGS